MGMLGSASVAGFILPYADFDQLAHAVVNRQRDTGRQSDIQQSEYDNQKPFHSFCKYSKCFQTPTNIKPEQAASAVRGHEMEHVYREQAKANREGRKVVSQNVTMHTEICPECGKSYVSGGTTRTVTKADTDNAAQQQDLARQNEEEQKARTPFSAVA